jgi:hypothetical protein
MSTPPQLSSNSVFVAVAPPWTFCTAPDCPVNVESFPLKVTLSKESALPP